MSWKSSIGFSGFEKLTFLVEISQNFNFFEKIEGGVPALRVIRAGTWLTVHRSLPYRTAVNWRHLGPAKIRDNGRHFYVFSDLLYQELLVCDIQIVYIIMKFDFVS